jgi:hypothetical protein
VNKIDTTLLLSFLWFLSGPSLGQDFNQNLAQNVYFEELPQYYPPTNYLHSSDAEFPLLKSQIKRGIRSITPDIYSFVDYETDQNFATFSLVPASPLDAEMVVSQNVTLSPALINSSARSFSELQASSASLDAKSFNAGLLTSASTEESTSLLYKALRFLLLWVLVSMLVTPFVLRIKIH